GSYETPHGASPTASGTYYWVATYSGDANNKEAVSGCADEPVRTGHASPSIETTQNPASGTVGDTFKDKATLAGAFGEHVGGTISFKLYDIKSYSPAERGVIATFPTRRSSDLGSYETPHGASPTASGTYYWVATYSGDANNKEAVSGCADEPVGIGQASPSIETTQNSAYGTIPDTCKDRTTLAGAFGEHVGGTISFNLYDNNSCSPAEGGPTATDVPAPSLTTLFRSTPHGASPTASGTYYWVATYSGDANNKEAVSGCADEPVGIGQASPSIET